MINCASIPSISRAPHILISNHMRKNVYRHKYAREYSAFIEQQMSRYGYESFDLYEILINSNVFFFCALFVSLTVLSFGQLRFWCRRYTSHGCTEPFIHTTRYRYRRSWRRNVHSCTRTARICERLDQMCFVASSHPFCFCWRWLDMLSMELTFC